MAARQHVLADFDDLGVRADADHRVRFGQFAADLLAVPLGKTARHDDGLDLPFRLELCEL